MPIRIGEHLAYGKQGLKAYLILEPGTKLFAHPIRGNDPVYTTHGRVLVEIVGTWFAGSDYTNVDARRLDQTTQLKVRVHVAENETDAEFFTRNRHPRGFPYQYWCRGCEGIAPIVGPGPVIVAWKQFEDGIIIR